MSTTTTNNTEVRFRKIRTGEWVLCGPAEVIESAVASGEKLEVCRRNGNPRHIAPLRHGKRFHEDGIVKCYGYTTDRPTCDGCEKPLPKEAKFCPSCGRGVVHQHTDNDFQGEGGLGLKTVPQLVAEKLAALR